jgi:adenylate cyclase
MIKKILVSPWTSLITLTLLVLLRVSDPMFVESIRLRYFDTVITSQPVKQNNIYTVNIDEATLDKYGQWPLPRDEYANLIDELYKRNAGLVVWNVLMPEQDRNGKDSELATALAAHPVILTNTPAQKSKNTPKQVGVSIMNSEFVDRIVQYPGLIANVSLLEENAAGVGIANVMPEIDGVNRRLPLVASVNNQLYPSVALETLRVAAGDPSFQIKLNELGVEKMRIPQFGPITTDPLGRIWIDWSQSNHSVSAVNLPDDFGGAIVIVGTSAAGIANPVPTAKGAVYPQDVQAAVIGTMINGVNIERPDWIDGAEILGLIIIGLVIIFISRWTYVGIVTSILIIGSVVPGSFFAFAESKWLVDATALIFGGIMVMLHCYGVKFISEFLQKQQIKKQFGTYLSPDLVAQLQRQPDLLKLGGESQELSIMFTDVRGFTTISEHYGKDVQGLTRIMNRYMTAMTKKILENKGTLDKYIGDAQMAFWNAPVGNSNHAKDAVKTALEMMESLTEFNEEVTKEGVPPFGMGLGINTDTVVVGNMGSNQRFDYTCLGDGVNLASRLEGQSKPYGVKIVLGPKTAEQVSDEYFILELDIIAVKGKTEGVNIFTVLETDLNSISKYAVSREQHDMMIHSYRTMQWDDSLRLISELEGQFDGQMDKYYHMMIERIQELREQNLPADWDTVYRTNSK